MTQRWKIPHIVKGMLTWLPFVYAWRLRHASTGGTNSPVYCYTHWLRHLVTLRHYGFEIKGAHVCELGPGDSIGFGLAALLSGAGQYVGLDRVQFSGKADPERIFSDLAQMFSSRTPILGYKGFVEPAIDWTDWGFPAGAVDFAAFDVRVDRIRGALRAGVNRDQLISYKAPWTSADDVAPASVDLVFSQSVMQCVDALEETYRATATWLKAGGYATHSIGFNAAWLSPFWNGHWAYSDWEWRLVRGRRAWLLNRAPP